MEELDELTLERCRRHDPVAFRAFVVRYQGPVFAMLSRMLGPGPHVEDLAQEGFLRAYRALPRFQPGGKAKASTWLLTIVTRLALDARNKKSRTEQPLSESPPAHEAESPERLAQRSSLGAALAAAASQLSPEQRAAFVLSQFHGLSVHEIAQTLGCPPATVKTRVLRARKRMREILEPERVEEFGS